MKFDDLVKSFLAIAGMHTLGHIDAADKKGFGMDIDLFAMGEKVRSKRNKKGPIHPDDIDMSFIHGSGFANQDRMSDVLGREGNLANALYKAGYLAGLPSIKGRKGDFARMGDIKGRDAKNMMKAAVLASTLFDFLKAANKIDKKNTDSLDAFVFDNGTPGIKFTRRF